MPSRRVRGGNLKEDKSGQIPARRKRIQEILYGENYDSSLTVKQQGEKDMDYKSIFMRLPELIQKYVARVLYGETSPAKDIDLDTQSFVTMGFVGVAIWCIYSNKMQNKMQGDGANSVAALIALTILSLLAQGDALKDLTSSEGSDAKTRETLNMLLVVPSAMYIAATAYCRARSCRDGAVADILSAGTPLLGSVLAVGAANGVLGKFLYEKVYEDEEEDATTKSKDQSGLERDQFTTVGFLSRFSDSVASLPGVLAVLLVFTQRQQIYDAGRRGFQGARRFRRRAPLASMDGLNPGGPMMGGGGGSYAHHAIVEPDMLPTGGFGIE